MEPRLPRRRRQRPGWWNIWVGIWVVPLLAGVACMAAPLVLSPSASPMQAQDAANVPAGVKWLPTSGPQHGTGAAQRPVPVLLNVPKAHIAASVIPVGFNAQGAMAAPEGANSDPVWSEAFWWQYGVMPGQKGNAVIAGHLDRKDGSPAIFWWLHELAVGDAVFVRTAQGTTLHFVVTAVQTFVNPTGGAANPVLERIFGPAQTANLNLITCTGDWTGAEYNKKLVVFTTLAP